MAFAPLLLAGAALAALAAASRRKTTTAYVPAGIPPANLTVLFDPAYAANLSQGSQFKAGLEQGLSSPNFVIEPSLTRIAQDTDGTWSGSSNGALQGGQRLVRQPRLLDVAAAASRMKEIEPWPG
jgi:hypothetical protein